MVGKIIPVLLLALFSANLISSADFDPYKPGPHETLRSFINKTVFEEVPTFMDIWAPVEAGNYPIVYFIDGFGGTVPGEFYEVILDKLASHGVTVVLPWKTLTGLTQEEKIPFFQGILDWCEENLVDFLFEEGETDPGLTINFDMAFGMGHSAGAHVLCSYLTANCGPFKGWALLSPVDGADPWGIKDYFCTQEDENVNFEIPTLILPAGLDNEKGVFYAACAPNELSNRRFYDAMDDAAPRWINNATYYGHTDFMDPFFQQFSESVHFCIANETASQFQLSTYRSYVAGQLTSFILGLQSDNCDDYFQYLEDPDLMTTNVDVDYSVSETVCPKPHCNWREPNTTEKATTEWFPTEEKIV